MSANYGVAPFYTLKKLAMTRPGKHMSSVKAGGQIENIVDAERVWRFVAAARQA
jgi:predicted TIM-barrel enzyme